MMEVLDRETLEAAEREHIERAKAQAQRKLDQRLAAATQATPKFTCFTSTTVQILTLMRLPGSPV
jgi:hypothetical protein